MNKATLFGSPARDDEPPLFTEAQRTALFDAILIDDEVDEQTSLPAAIRADYPATTLRDCFLLCRELWWAGFGRAELVALCALMIRDRDLGVADRVRFKHVRAKFKHFRYAFELYAQGSRRPLLFDRITIAMGHAQDAYRNGHRGAVLRHALILRLLLTSPVQALLAREVRGAALASPAVFRAMIGQDRDALTALLARDRVTGAELHRARKIVGRRVSFYDTLRTLHPTPDAVRMSRSLSAINGLMGALHDDLIARRAGDRDSYHDEAFVLPRPIRERLEALVAVPIVAGDDPAPRGA